jgi:hypothetical protein
MGDMQIWLVHQLIPDSFLLLLFKLLQYALVDVVLNSIVFLIKYMIIIYIVFPSPDGHHQSSLP